MYFGDIAELFGGRSMNEIEKNTVSAVGQVKYATYGTQKNETGMEKRILFVGNSITLHEKCEEIGWHGNYGMAASSLENDYVHLLMKMICEKRGKAIYRIAQVARWEWNYKTGYEVLKEYQDARDFEADIIIFRLIENCPLENFEKEVFKAEYKKLIDFFNKNNHAHVILTTGFWRHPGDEMIMEAARENGYALVELGYLGEDEKMKAIDLFEHEGVANHPSDLGMRKIAELLWEQIKIL